MVGVAGVARRLGWLGWQGWQKNKNTSQACDDGDNDAMPLSRRIPSLHMEMSCDQWCMNGCNASVQYELELACVNEMIVLLFEENVRKREKRKKRKKLVDADLEKMRGWRGRLLGQA